MLTELNLYNFTIVKTLTIPFGAGMTVITGESGAGKSIIIQALELCLGKRSEQRMIGPFADQAHVSATFDCSTYPTICQWLQTHDYDTEPLGLCVIRRIINAEGHSKTYLNDQPCTNQRLKTLGALMVNFHGQHENQALLTRDHQRLILDHYANLSSATAELKTIVQSWRALEKRQHALLQPDNQTAQQLSLLQYQLDELNALDLQPQELTELEQTHQTLAKADTILNDCQTILSELAEHDASLLQRLKQQLHTLQAYSTQPTVAHIITCLQDAIIQLDEAEHLLRSYLTTVPNDPATLATIEQRLSQIHDLARKHRVPAHALPDHMQALMAQCQANQSQQAELAQIQQQMTDLAAQYHDLATTISKKRQTTATQLSQTVTKQINRLGLNHCFFKIILSPQEQPMASHGLESVGFLVGHLPSTDAYPLHKVASGGELSRISLAIQASTAQHRLLPTLVFDEVDVGLSGGTTEIVGQQLKTLGASAQVLCITHLPQVAARADQQIKIDKILTETTTTIHATVLTNTQRVQEIARMLGGLKITAQTLRHAEEILNKKDTLTTTEPSSIAS